MKRSLLSAAVLIMASLTLSLCNSCDKIEDVANITFSMTNADANFEIPPILATGTADLGSQSVSLNLDSLIKAQNGALSSDNIKNVHLTSCVLELSDGDSSNNFSALQACTLQLASDVKPDFVTLGSVTDNPDVVAYTLNLPLNTDLELKDYFTSGRTFTYKMSATARKTTNKTLHCNIKLKYAITIGPS